MSVMSRTCSLAAVLLVAFVVGCGQSVSKVEKEKDHDHDHAVASAEKHEHKHDGWWCDEHGVPEEDCSRCDSKLAAELQKKGDWCKDHDRADSQCFVCHPELEAKFAARYVAKFGKQPPKPE
jgi:hypothetical protein